MNNTRPQEYTGGAPSLTEPIPPSLSLAEANPVADRPLA